jgi:hypothetical protein
MENNFKNKLKNLIEISRLTMEEKALWSLFMKISLPEEDEAVFEAAAESQDNLTLLTKHLQGKIYEMKERNKKAWDKLIKDEFEYAALLN